MSGRDLHHAVDYPAGEMRDGAAVIFQAVAVVQAEMLFFQRAGDPQFP